MNNKLPKFFIFVIGFCFLCISCPFTSIQPPESSSVPEYINGDIYLGDHSVSANQLITDALSFYGESQNTSRAFDPSRVFVNLIDLGNKFFLYIGFDKAKTINEMGAEKDAFHFHLQLLKNELMTYRELKDFLLKEIRSYAQLISQETKDKGLYLQSNFHLYVKRIGNQVKMWTYESEANIKSTYTYLERNVFKINQQLKVFFEDCAVKWRPILKNAAFSFATISTKIFDTIFLIVIDGMSRWFTFSTLMIIPENLLLGVPSPTFSMEEINSTTYDYYVAMIPLIEEIPTPILNPITVQASTATLTWSCEVTGLTYKIYRSENNSSYNFIDSTTNTYYNNDISAGFQYSYYVSAVSGNNEGIHSNTQSINVQIQQPLIRVYYPGIVSLGNECLFNFNSRFGDIPYTRAAAWTFFLTNDGNGVLTFLNNPRAILSGINADDFLLGGDIGTGTLNHGETTSFNIQFNPKSPGTKNAQIVIRTNSPNGDFIIYLSGTGI